MKQIIRRVAALVIGLGLGAAALAGLETVTHISDLNTSWPLGSDLASTSDDHIRNIKTALKTDFPNINAAVTATPTQLNQLTTNSFASGLTVSSGNLTVSSGNETLTSGSLTLSSGNLTLSSGSETVTGNVTANALIPSSSTVPTNGIFLPAANTLGFSSNSTKWGSVNSTGNWSFVTPTSGTAVTVNAISNARAIDVSDGTSTLDFSTNASHAWYLGTVDAHDFSLQSGSIGGSRVVISGTTGNVTINAATATYSLRVAGAANNQAARFDGNGTSGQSFGVVIAAGTTSADEALGVYNQAASTEYLKVRGDGAIQGGGPVAGALVDMTPDTGTFTATMTGGSTSPTCTARWTRIGNLVMLEICSATATSNATSFTYTGLPSAVQPTVTQHVPAASSSYEDNSAVQPSTVEVVLTASSGTITFWHNGASTGWTNSGVKGVLSINTVSYLLN